jgi:hypothetical protein
MLVPRVHSGACFNTSSVWSNYLLQCEKASRAPMTGMLRHSIPDCVRLEKTTSIVCDWVWNRKAEQLIAVGGGRHEPKEELLGRAWQNALTP